ncbi:putative F0F1-ATPase subunit [bacterium BMS3Bbin02]|nr:putative F0F1-ATPase subunit [bacterium BMS3Bbin02]
MDGDDQMPEQAGTETQGSGDVPAARHAIVGEFSQGGDFLSSIVAGLLLGLLADHFLNTRPVFVIFGIVAGFSIGFYKLWLASAVLEREAERLRGR